MTGGVALGVVGVGGYLLYRWGRGEERRVARRFDAEVMLDAADSLARHLGANRRDALRALGGWVETGERPDLLRGVIRIDYRVTWPDEAAGECVRDVLILLAAGGGDGRLVRVSRAVPDDQLPRSVRDDYLRHPGASLTYPLVASNRPDRADGGGR